MYDYNRNLSWSKLRVGIIVSTVLAIVLLTVIFASNLGSIFAPKVTIYADFSDVRGLTAGAPVQLSGVQIGTVTGVHFRSGGQVRVALAIDKKYLHFIRKDSHATLNTLGLLGTKYIELSPGLETSAALPPKGVIAGRVPPEFEEIISAGQADFVKLGELEKGLERILHLMEYGGGSISKFINDPSLYDNLNNSSKRLAAILDSVQAGKGTLGRLIKDDALYADLQASARDIKEFTGSLTKSRGTLEKVIRDPALYDKFLSFAGSLEDFSAKLEQSKGTLDRLIEDKSLYENMDKSSRELSILLGQLAGPVSVELEQAISDLKALIEDIKKNPKKYFKFSLF